jgi:hypothetical protein
MYAGTTELIAYLGITNPDKGMLLSCLESAQAAINTYTRRTFEATTGTLYYHQYDTRINGQVLYLDREMLSVTTLVNGNGQTVTPGAAWSSQYFLEPRNEGPPYTMIRLGFNTPWIWSVDQPIIISGTIGYSVTAPDDIVQATKRLAGYMYRLRDAPTYDVSASPDTGVITVNKGFPADVEFLLKPYRRPPW